MFENEISKNKYFGRDEYMNPVVVESKIDIVGQIKNVLISDFSKQTIYGKISKEEKISQHNMSILETPSSIIV